MALRNIENGLRLLTKIDKWKSAAWRSSYVNFKIPKKKTTIYDLD
jgi:hypothetical protein